MEGYARAVDALYTIKESIAFGRIDMEDIEEHERPAKTAELLSGVYMEAANGITNQDLRNPQDTRNSQELVKKFQEIEREPKTLVAVGEIAAAPKGRTIPTISVSPLRDWKGT
jgi:hypothetical protein